MALERAQVMKTDIDRQQLYKKCALFLFLSVIAARRKTLSDTHTATFCRTGIKSQEMQDTSARPGVRPEPWDLNVLQVHIYLDALHGKCVNVCTVSEA